MSTSALMPSGPFAGGSIQFDKQKQFLNGDASAGIQVTADADPDVLEAILKGTPLSRPTDRTRQNQRPSRSESRQE